MGLALLCHKSCFCKDKTKKQFSFDLPIQHNIQRDKNRTLCTDFSFHFSQDTASHGVQFHGSTDSARTIKCQEKNLKNLNELAEMWVQLHSVSRQGHGFICLYRILVLTGKTMLHKEMCPWSVLLSACKSFDSSLLAYDVIILQTNSCIHIYTHIHINENLDHMLTSAMPSTGFCLSTCRIPFFAVRDTRSSCHWPRLTGSSLLF